MATIINIKPLSVNECWQGRRFKTPAYTKYEKNVMAQLVAMKLPLAPYRIDFVVGFSNKLSDIDNFIKPILDIMQKRYKFNDRDIYELHIKKTIVPKGKEFILFDIQNI